MVGRSVELRVTKAPAQPGDVVLDVQHLSVAGDVVPIEAGGSRNSVDDVSFEVRAGEILGIAGVQGNGQTELCEALMGLLPSAGAVLLDGKNISRRQPAGPAAGRHRLHPGGSPGRRPGR